MNCLLPSKPLRRLALALSLLGAAAASQASSLLLDDFSAPAAPQTGVAFGDPSAPSSDVLLRDFTASVPGGVRETLLNVYGNPLSSISAVLVGGGVLSVAQGAGATAETIVSYGAFTRPTGDPQVGGPLLGLDLSAYTGLSFDFTGSEFVLNVNVTYYTSAPLDPGAPLYYSNTGINIAPATQGGPLSFELAFDNNPAFNWQQVDGVVVLINRSGPTPASAYTLDTLTFTTAVPEPQTLALMLAGLGVVVVLARRRIQGA
jgi:hypothetical protein